MLWVPRKILQSLMKFATKRNYLLFIKIGNKLKKEQRTLAVYCKLDKIFYTVQKVHKI